MSLCNAYKRNPLIVGSIALLISFILFGLACGLHTQIRLDAKSEEIDTSKRELHASTPSSSSSSSIHTSFKQIRKDIKRMIQPYLTNIVANGIDATTTTTTTIDNSDSFLWGFFQFCIDYSISTTITSTAEDGTITTLSSQSTSIDHCMMIQPSCSVDLTPFVIDELEAQGFNSTQIDQIRHDNPEEWSIFEDIAILGDCTPFNAARAFAAMATIVAGLSGILFLCLWKRKIRLVTLNIAAVAATIFGIIGFSLIISVEQSDPNFDLLRELISYGNDSSDPNSSSSGNLTFGVAFIMFVLGLTFSLLSTISITFELWKRTDGGQLNAFTLQENPESGILESHVSMYEQM